MISFNFNVVSHTHGLQQWKMQKENGAHNAIKMRKNIIRSFLSNRGFRSRKLMKNYSKSYLQRQKEFIYKSKVLMWIISLPPPQQQWIQFQFWSIIRRLIMKRRLWPRNTRQNLCLVKTLLVNASIHRFYKCTKSL